ncbi:unnamed protein product [Ectocarpus sp. 4 AP-2014]
MFQGSEGMGAKVHVREGKNPDHQLRSPNIGPAWIMIGHKHITEAMALQFTVRGRGAFCSALKVHCEVCWSVQKRKCRHK